MFIKMKPRTISEYEKTQVVLNYLDAAIDTFDHPDAPEVLPGDLLKLLKKLEQKRMRHLRKPKHIWHL